MNKNMPIIPPISKEFINEMQKLDKQFKEFNQVTHDALRNIFKSE